MLKILAGVLVFSLLCLIGALAGSELKQTDKEASKAKKRPEKFDMRERKLCKDKML